MAVTVGGGGGDDAVTEPRLLPTQWPDGCGLPNRCQTPQTPCTTPLRSPEPLRPPVMAVAAGLAALVCKPGARTTKWRASREIIGNACAHCAACTPKVGSAHCVRRLPSPPAHALVPTLRRPLINPSAQAAPQNNRDSSAEKDVRMAARGRKYDTPPCRVACLPPHRDCCQRGAAHDTRQQIKQKCRRRRPSISHKCRCV